MVVDEAVVGETADEEEVVDEKLIDDQELIFSTPYP